MKHLLNTLYVTAPERYHSLDGKNVVIRSEDEEIGRIPLHNLEAIVTFGYQGSCTDGGLCTTKYRSKLLIRQWPFSCQSIR